MDEEFFRRLSSQYCESCLLLNILASERLLDRLKRNPSYEVPQGKEEVLEILDLSECSLNDNDAQVISALLVKEEVIKAVDLSSNQIGDAGAVALSELLIPNAFVSQLNLSQNNVAEIGGLAFCNALSRKVQTDVHPVVTLKQNPLPLNVIDLLNSYTKKNEEGSSLKVSIASLLNEVEANDFSSSDDEIVDKAMHEEISDKHDPPDDTEDDKILERYVRSSAMKSDLDIEGLEILELPEYSLDIEEIARKDFLEQGVQELLVDTDEIILSNLSFPLSDFEAKLKSIQTCHITLLDLSSNDLTCIPNYLPETLRKLVMKENRIQRIENLFNCPHLQTLNLEQNSIGVSGEGYVSGLCALDLCELSLSNNSLSELDILNSIGHLQKLENLDISKNSLEPVEVIQQLGETHSASLLHLTLSENAGNYDYKDIARKKLRALRTLDNTELSECSPTKEEPKISKLFGWRLRRKNKDKIADEKISHKQANVPSADLSEDAPAQSSFDFGDFILLSARMGILELPKDRSTFSYFAKTSEYLNELFHDLDDGKTGCISAKKYAIGFDKIQKHFAHHVSRDVRRRSISSIIDSRVNIQEYLGNSSLQGLYGSFSNLEAQDHPITNGYMTFLDLLRWIDTCFINGASKKTSTQRKLIVSFFTRERKVPKFNFLDFVFSIFFVCSMTKLSAEKIVKHVVKHMKSTKPIMLASTEEMTSLDTLKANHIYEVSKENWPKDARKMYHDVYKKGFPIEDFVKHKDTNLLLTVLEIAVEEQEKYAAADNSRIIQLRKDLSNVTKQIKELVVL